MATYFDRFQADFARVVPDFNRLKVGTHKTDPRAATSIVIAAMAAALSVMLSLAFREPARYSVPVKTGEQLAPPPAAGKVTIVAATPRMDVPCGEQTWPYIDRRCLTESTQKRPQPEGRPVEPAAVAPPIDARAVATPPVAPAVNPPAPPAVEPQGGARQDGTVASQPREWAAESNGIMQNEVEDEWVPMMPPPDQYRRDRRRYYDPGRQIERQFRQFTRHIFPRF